LDGKCGSLERLHELSNSCLQGEGFTETSESIQVDCLLFITTVNLKAVLGLFFSYGGERDEEGGVLMYYIAYTHIRKENGNITLTLARCYHALKDEKQNQKSLGAMALSRKRKLQ